MQAKVQTIVVLVKYIISAIFNVEILGKAEIIITKWIFMHFE